jgi:K+-sensing histidine kinase KdpD
MGHFDKKHRAFVTNLGWLFLFCAGIFLITVVTQGASSLANTATVGFLFLVLVTLSAYFTNRTVAILVALVAALSFDENFLPPFGTLNIASVTDWICLGVFVLMAVVTAGLTASAARTNETNTRLKEGMGRLSTLVEGLSSTRDEDLSLASVAERIVNQFQVSYCSLHVYSCGKWDHAFGSARTTVSDRIEAHVQTLERPLDWTVMVKESELGVRYFPIRNQTESYAILAIRDDDLPPEVSTLLASFVGSRLASTSPPLVL